MSENSDILENEIISIDKELMHLLLIDRTKSTDDETHNLIWATDNYTHLGKGYGEWDEITVESITGDNGNVLRPRVNKSKEEQEHRSRDKAEVFTAAWICNKQNNLIDTAWFGTEESPFNKETEKGWQSKTEHIKFPEDKTWEDYVKDTRLEMTCGEAPYLISRYNVVTGDDIPVSERIGLLDRKLRVICENIDDEKEWNKWAIVAYKNIYGFEWQGDNLLLAREAMIYTYFDYYKYKFNSIPSIAQSRKIAEIVSWNLWQMDGLKGVIPGSCGEKISISTDLFGDEVKTVSVCQGCKNDDIRTHNGIYCKIMDWGKRKPIRYIDLLK